MKDPNSGSSLVRASGGLPPSAFPPEKTAPHSLEQGPHTSVSVISQENISAALPSSTSQQPRAQTSTADAIPQMLSRQAYAPTAHKRPLTAFGNAFTPATVMELAAGTAPPERPPSAAPLPSAATALTAAEPSADSASGHEASYRSAVMSANRHVMPQSTAGGTDGTYRSALPFAGSEGVSQAAWQPPANQLTALQQTRAAEVKRLRTLMQQSRVALASRWGVPGGDSRVEKVSPGSAVSRLPPAEAREPPTATASAGEPAEAEDYRAAGPAVAKETLVPSRTVETTEAPAQMTTATEEAAAAAAQELAASLLARKDTTLRGPALSKRLVSAGVPAPSPSTVAALEGSVVAVAAQEKVAAKKTTFKKVQEAPGVEAWRRPTYPAKAEGKEKAKAFIPKVIMKKKVPFGKRPLPKRAPLPGAAAGAGGDAAAEVAAAQEQEGEEKGGEEQPEETNDSLPFSVATFPSRESGDSEFNLTASDFLDRLPATTSVRSLSSPGGERAGAGEQVMPSMLRYRRAGETETTDKALSEVFRSRMVEDGALRIASRKGVESALFRAEGGESFEREPSAAAVEEEEGEEEEKEEREGEEEAEREELEKEEKEEEEEARVSAEGEKWKISGLAGPAVLATAEEEEEQEVRREEEEEEEEEVDLSLYDRSRRRLKREERDTAAAQRAAARGTWRRLTRAEEEKAAAAAAAAPTDRKVLLRAAAEEEQEEELTFRAAPEMAAEEERRRQGEERRRQRETRRPRAVEDRAGLESVGKRADDLAAQEDYERAALSLESAVEVLPPIPGLSPALDRLRKEREELSQWVRRLRRGVALRAPGRGLEEGGPSYLVSESGTLLRMPLRRTETTAAEFARTYAAAAAGLAAPDEARLEKPLEAEGPFIEERLAQEMTMPSSAVFSLEKRLQRQLQQLGQQRRHVTLLQKMLWERGGEGAAAHGSVREVDGEGESREGEIEAGTGGGGGVAAVTQQILEEQCNTLLQRFEQEKEHSTAYKLAWIETYKSKEAAREKCEALRKRLELLQAAKNMREARREEEEEKLRECREDLQTQAQALARTQSSREQYEYQLLVLQQRYEELRSYLQEWQEKASSFEEALLESTSNLQQQTALLQVERHASLRLKELLRERDEKVARLEVEVRVERDKLLLGERAAQQLQAAVAEQERLRTAAEEEVQQERQHLAAEQNVHQEARVLLQQREQQLQQLQEEVQGLHASEEVAAERKNKIKKLAAAAAQLLYRSGNRVAAAEKAVRKVEKRRQRALQLLQKARDVAQQQQQQLREKQQEQERDLQQQITQDKERLRQQEEEIEALKQNLQQFRTAAEAAAQKQEGAALLEAQLQLQEERELRKKEQQQQQQLLEQEQAAKQQLEKKLQEQQEDRRRLQGKLATFAFSSQGRSSSESPQQLLRVMRGGTPMERSAAFKKKVSLQYVKLSGDKKTILCTSAAENLTGSRRNSGIPISDVVAVEFGTASAACVARVAASGTRARNLKKLSAVLPWQCFAVYTPLGGDVFVAPSPAEAEAWVVGLGYLAPPVAPNIRSRHEFLVKRGYMKLQYYCQKKRISMTQLWKSGIAKTVRERQDKGKPGRRREGRRESAASKEQQQVPATAASTSKRPSAAAAAPPLPPAQRGERKPTAKISTERKPSRGRRTS